MEYWSSSRLKKKKEKKKTRPPIPAAPTHCLKYQPYLPVQDKETRGLHWLKGSDKWRIDWFFFSSSFFLFPRQCLGVSWILAAETRPVLCEQKPPSRHKSPVIPLYRNLDAPLLHTHPPVTAVHKIQTEKTENKRQRRVFTIYQRYFLMYHVFKYTKVYCEWKEYFWFMHSETKGALCLPI